MEGIRRNYDNSISYEEKIHHRQFVQKKILPQTIDQLENNSDPCYVSKMAKMQLERDQLDRLMQRKNGMNTKPNELNPIVGYTGMVNKIKSNSLFGQVARNNFRDYHQEKENRIEELVSKNSNGGFGRASEQHQMQRKKLAQQVGQTLNAQIRYNENRKQQYKKIRMQQQEARLQQERLTKLRAQQKRLQQLENKQNTRNIYINQIEEKRARNSSHDNFSYNNQTTHHPINNPIPFRINNEYVILEYQKLRQKQKLKLAN